MNEMHYVNDRQLGSACIINGISVYAEYNADLASFNATSGSVTQKTKEKLGKSSLLPLEQELDVGSLTLVFYVGGNTKDNCDLNCSRLVAIARECVIKTEDDGFEYVCCLSGKKIEASGINFWNVVTLEFVALKRYPLVTVDITEANQDVVNLGTIASGVRYIVKATSTKTNYEIMDINIERINSGETFVIDGIEGEVTVNGVNSFNKTDLITFPKIEPGHNTIVTSTLSGVKVQLQFYPVLVW